MNDQQQNEQMQQLRQQMMLRKMLLRQGMSAEARERLGRVKLANPELGERAEMICLQLIQQGRKISDNILKEVLDRLSPKKEIRIRRI